MSDGAQSDRRTERRTFLAGIFSIGIGANFLSESMDTPTDEKTADVSVEVPPEEIAVPPAVAVSVDQFNDADAVRVIQPQSVPAIQTIDKQGLHYLTVNGIRASGGLEVESVHGDWRTTIGRWWLVKDDDGQLAVSDEEPSLEDSATWALEDQNRTVPREGGSE